MVNSLFAHTFKTILPFDRSHQNVHLGQPAVALGGVLRGYQKLLERDYLMVSGRQLVLICRMPTCVAV